MTRWMWGLVACLLTTACGDECQVLPDSGAPAAMDGAPPDVPRGEEDAGEPLGPPDAGPPDAGPPEPDACPADLSFAQSCTAGDLCVEFLGYPEDLVSSIADQCRRVDATPSPTPCDVENALAMCRRSSPPGCVVSWYGPESGPLEERQQSCVERGGTWAEGDFTPDGG